MRNDHVIATWQCLASVYPCLINSDDIEVKVTPWQPLDDVGGGGLLHGNHLDT